MSEYRSCEFLVIDRPLDDAERGRGSVAVDPGEDHRHQLRERVPRGDFKGDPSRLMKRCYDAHLDVAN